MPRSIGCSLFLYLEDRQMKSGSRASFASAMRIMQRIVEPVAEQQFLDGLRTSGPAVPVTPDAWPTEPGRVHEVTRKIFWYFLEVLPPKFMNAGGFSFGFAEGQEPLTVYWRSGSTHYARLLTWDETNRVCDIVGIKRDYWF